MVRDRDAAGSGPPPASFFASLSFDRRLAAYDVRGSAAWAHALAACGVLTLEEEEAILGGLRTITAELEAGTFPFREELEDIHFNVERRLTELIGPLGGKLHTGRSRNDQVATDLRLYMKDAIDGVTGGLRSFRRETIAQAEAHVDTVMPGYTHLQRAQPILLAHHLMAYVAMAERDSERFRDTRRRTDVLPLGSAALAGTAYAIDREALASDLDFRGGATRNSIDAVSDRDFVVEFEAAAAMAMAHLSRLAEEIVLWSSDEFRFVEVSSDYTSGSSIMPQKRNPDAAELVRGKTGRVYGHLLAMLVTLKGLPLSYNRDLQEDKEGLFDTVDTLLASLDIMTGMMRELRFRPEPMADNARGGFLLATELADYLSRKGVPFRQGHGVVRQLVTEALSVGRNLGELTLEDFRRAAPEFEPDVLAITAESAIAARNVIGGTARGRVTTAIDEARARLASEENDRD